MDLEDIIVREISQRKKILYDLTYVESTETKFIETETKLVVARVVEGRGEGGQKVQNPTYQINKLWGCNHDCSTVLYIWKLLKE